MSEPIKGTEAEPQVTKRRTGREYDELRILERWVTPDGIIMESRLPPLPPRNLYNPKDYTKGWEGPEEPNEEVEPPTRRVVKPKGFDSQQITAFQKELNKTVVEFDNPAYLTLRYSSLEQCSSSLKWRADMQRFKDMVKSGWNREGLQAFFKAETDSRGVPHVMLWFDIPQGVSRHSTASNRAKYGDLNGLTFEDWIEEAWPIASQQEDEGSLREFTSIDTSADNDKKRVADYFAKQSEALKHKSYQNRLPDGWDQGNPIKMWGKFGLRKKYVKEVITPKEHLATKRVVRKLFGKYEAIDKETGEIKTKDRNIMSSNGLKGGYVITGVSDKLASQLREVGKGSEPAKKSLQERLEARRQRREAAAREAEENW